MLCLLAHCYSTIWQFEVAADDDAVTDADDVVIAADDAVTADDEDKSHHLCTNSTTCSFVFLL